MNTNCPNSLKRFLSSKTYFDQEELKRHLETTKNELLNDSTNYYLIIVMQIVENYIDNEINSSHSQNIKIYGIINILISKLVPKPFWISDWKERIKKDLGQNNFYSILNFLSPLRLSEQMAQIQNSIEDISNLNDVNGISKFLINLNQLKLDKEELRLIFSCPTFLHYLHYGIEDFTVLKNVRDLVCEERVIPNYVQPELARKLKEILNPDEIILNSGFCSLTDAYKKFGQLIQANMLPENFKETLLRSLATNLDFHKEMTSCGALFYYNAKGLFDQPWDIDTLKSAHRKIEKTLEGIESEKYGMDYSDLKLDISLTSKGSRSTTTGQDSVSHPQEVGVSTKGVVTVKRSQTLTMREFVQIQAIIPKPGFDENVNVKMKEILPYMVQKIKMWGIHAIQPDHIHSFFQKFIQELPESNSEASGKFNFNMKRVQNQEATGVKTDKAKLTPLSRIDVLTYIAGCSETIVLQDILKIISLFPVGLPLVLNNFSQSTQEQAKIYIFLRELLKVATFKWETKTGIVQYHQLFGHKFKLILAIRIGSEDEKYSCGKSTILNQLLSNKNTFSSNAEPGATRGKPIFLDGTVEFVPLTQEICTPGFYEQCLKSHYDEDNNEIILLANLHGNATKYKPLIEELDSIVSSYLVFFTKQTVAELEDNYTKFDAIVNLGEVFLVDPLEECKDVVGENNIIDTVILMEDHTLDKVRLAVLKCVNRRTRESNYEHKTHTSQLTRTPHVETEESKQFIDYVSSKSCGFVKDKMSLQKPEYQKRKFVKELYSIWKNDAELRKIITMFVSCLYLPVDSRDQAMIHIDREISGLSSKETEQCRRDLLELQDEQSRIINLDDLRDASKERAKVLVKLNMKYNELDRKSLGMEHFYREIGRLYEITLLNRSDPANNVILKLPQLFAELLIRGHALEILDGDLGDINEYWFSAVCNAVSKEFAHEAKIYVVSILGLQSSGKSTLLNALFGCKFAVSTGRCTKGLFMRLLLLDEELRKKMGIDMILLIDTEGLGAPEKMNDPGNEQKDRLMATFAMSVSNLTLINVLGESIRDLTEILQIVIVTMARLEQADISPDILMVQHLQERDKSKTLGGSKEFVTAIEEAIKITDSKNVTEVGIKNSKSLRNLIQRVQDGQILKQFRSFKNGATLNAPPSREYHEDVVNLFETILASCQRAENPMELWTWINLIPKYWSNIADQNFALRFKNLKQISEFLHRGNKIANLKEKFNQTLRYHQEECEVQIRSELQEFERQAQKNSADWTKRKENLFKNVTDVITSIPNCSFGSETSPCEQCTNFQNVRENLLENVKGKEFESDTEITVNSFVAEKKDSVKKQLKQFINAQEVKNGISSEFDEIIDNILKEELKVKKTFSGTERKRMVDNVWEILERKVSEKNSVAPVRRRIITEARNVYRNNNDLINSINNNGQVHNPSVEQQDYLPNFLYIPAYDYNVLRLDKRIKGAKDNIDLKQKTELESGLERATDTIILESTSKFFDDGMVQKLHQITNEIVAAFEKNHRIKLLIDFIWKIHEYALKYFITYMEKREFEWNRSHNPMTILKMKEQEFKKNIEIRLEYGFTFDGEERIAAEKIMTALSILAQKASNKSHRDYILGLTWMTNSGNIRLKYFKELSREVQSDDKNRALQHFQDPKSQILKWFISKVNSLSGESAGKLYEKTAESEFEQMVQLIRNESSGFEIKRLIDQLLNKVDGVDYRTTLDFNAQESDVLVYKSSILFELEAKKELLIEAHDWQLEFPSAHPDIMGRLGCTEHCPFCGALCWGQFGHEMNTDGTSKHHTCHQPQGLIGVHYRTGSKMLLAKKCDETDLDEFWSWGTPDGDGGFEVGGKKYKNHMKWRDTIVHEDFRHWTFNAHPQNDFNDFMKWFFVSLQNDIAKSRGANIASQDELDQLGFQNLAKIDSILTTISERIGN